MEPRTLVLTSYMQPNRIASWTEAVCLWFTQKCDILESYEATISSPSVTIQVPAVVRLRKDISTHKRAVKFSRLNIYQRDGWRCCFCGEKKPPRDLTYDHVIPRSRGGTTTWTNIVTACKADNRRKDNRTPREAGMTMHFKPYKPTSLPMGQPILMLADNIPDIWRPYLEATTQTA